MLKCNKSVSILKKFGLFIIFLLPGLNGFSQAKLYQDVFSIPILHHENLRFGVFYKEEGEESEKPDCTCPEGVYPIYFNGQGQLIGAPPDKIDINPKTGKVFSGNNPYVFRVIVEGKGKEIEKAVLPLYTKVLETYYSISHDKNNTLSKNEKSEILAEYEMWIYSVQKRFPVIIPEEPILSSAFDSASESTHDYVFLTKPSILFNKLLSIHITHTSGCNCADVLSKDLERNDCGNYFADFTLNDCDKNLKFDLVINNPENIMVKDILSKNTVFLKELTKDVKDTKKWFDNFESITIASYKKKITKIPKVLNKDIVFKKIEAISDEFVTTKAEDFNNHVEQYNSINNKIVAWQKSWLWYTKGQLVLDPLSPVNKITEQNANAANETFILDSFEKAEKLKIWEKILLDQNYCKACDQKTLVDNIDSAGKLQRSLYARAAKKTGKALAPDTAYTSAILNHLDVPVKYINKLDDYKNSSTYVSTRHHDAMNDFSIMNQPVKKEYLETAPVFIIVHNTKSKISISWHSEQISDDQPQWALEAAQPISIMKNLNLRDSIVVFQISDSNSVYQMIKTTDMIQKSLSKLIDQLPLYIPVFKGLNPKPQMYDQVFTPSDQFTAPANVYYKLAKVDDAPAKGGATLDKTPPAGGATPEKTTNTTTTSTADKTTGGDKTQTSLLTPAANPAGTPFDKSVWPFSYRLNKLYRFVPAAGMVYGGHVSPDVNDQNKIILNNYSDLILTAGIKTYFHKADIRNTDFFPASNLGIYTGVNIMYPFRSFQVGFTLDIIRGFTLSAGTNLVRSTQPIFLNGQVVDHNDYLQPTYYFGVLIDFELFRSIGSFLFQAPNIANPASAGPVAPAKQ